MSKSDRIAIALTVLFALFVSLGRSRRAKRVARSFFRGGPFILGHRGARVEAAENTLASFLLAMELGADGVELDVHLSKDGVPVVIHDYSVERTTGHEGRVSDFTAHELSFMGDGIPTLEEVLAAMPDRAIVNVELKGADKFGAREFVRRLLTILEKHYHRLRILLSSFDGGLLVHARRMSGHFAIGLLLATDDDNWPRVIRNIRQIKPDALNVDYQLISPVWVSLARMTGVEIVAWTVDIPALGQSLIKHGVNTVITNDVRAMR